MIPGVVAAAGVVIASGPADPVQVQRAQGAAGSGTTSSAATLSGAPTSGNTLLMLVKATTTTVAQFQTPAGWTIIDSGQSTTNVQSWVLYGKTSVGTETTCPTVTFDVSHVQGRVEYQEWSGLPLAGILDATNTSKLDEGGSTQTVYNPGAVTLDQDRGVYLCIAATSSSNGGVTSDWANATATYNAGNCLFAHKVVTDGSAFDTTVTWTTARPFAGAVICLRGED